jgi:c(7)-type cytochrome triheme protein
MKLRFTVLAVLFGMLAPIASFAKETKDIQFKFKNAEPVVFSHDFHLGLSLINNNCKKCHNAIFNLRERRHYTMAEMEKTKSCGACHTGVKAFSVADEKSCVRCHKGKPRSISFKPKGASEAEFSHELHIAKTGGKCRSCHNSTVITGKDKNVTMAQMEKGKTCGACHDGKKAFTVAANCGNCHKGMKPREIVFKAPGINDAVFSHKFHLEMAYTCKDCHTKVFPYKAGAKQFTMAEMEQGKACGTCHNSKDAATVVGNCNRCHKGFKPGDITFKTDGGDVKFSHGFHLDMYKCEDCHTKRFPYKAGVKHFGMAGMEAGNSCGGCHNGKDAFSVKGDCDKCHKM